MAWNNVIGWTRRVVGNDAVKTGSKMAARYKASIGEVLDDAMMLPCCGSRALFFFRELLLLARGRSRGDSLPVLPFLDSVDL